MDPETPSRRKKSGENPVTIDLEASPAASEETPPQETVASGDTAAADTPLPETPADEPPVTETVLPADEPAPAARVEEEGEAAVRSPPPQATARSNTGSVAAGILGGLIALLGAGSLQYGGYLPSLGPQQGDDGTITRLSNEVAALTTRVAETGTPPPVDLQPIETRIAALEKAAEESSAGNADAASTLQADVTRLSAEITELREAIARTSQAVTTTEGQLAERIAAAEQKLEEPRSDIAMARAVAASALKTAIDRGGSYLAELEAFASVAPDDAALAGLREHAATGVSSRSDLVRDFNRTADAILDAVHQPDGDQGIINRLMSSAASAIRVRPVGSIEGDTPEAVVARIENKLQNGDFKGAQIEWQALPEAGQAAGADYKRMLDQRVSVEELIGSAVSGAMTGGNQG